MKAKDSGDDTMLGHLHQAWREPRGVPIPDTQFSFGGEEDDGGDEEVFSNITMSRSLKP